ncbi:MAG: haloacid dehalogenase-like hydrolase [Blastochloris sp.]|nr:haloacid dehalogenase-like hydrolase [Blastochloris sp.]
MAEKKLLLWDIDGTLVCTGKAGEAALGLALERCFGIKGSISQVDFRGRTDRRIGAMLLDFHRIDKTAENMHEFMECYLTLLAQELPQREGKVHIGILDILEKCRINEDYISALLTGNLERGARLKLDHFSVWHYFEFGAFADDSADRNELGPVALQRSVEKTGLSIPPERVYVIGDTPHDIACARVIGAKVIAVATGGYTYEELAAEKPDALFVDFKDPEAFFEVLERL